MPKINDLLTSYPIDHNIDLSLFPSPLVCIDIETTAFKAEAHAIIEIAVLRLEKGKAVHGFSTLLRTEDVRQNPKAQAVHKITNQQLAFAPTFSDIVPLLQHLCSDAILVAQNANFERRFLDGELKALGGQWGQPELCTLALAKKVLPQLKGNGGHGLSKLIDHFNITPPGSMHVALVDTFVLIPLLEKLIDTAQSNNPSLVTAAIKTLNPPSTWPKLQISAQPLKNRSMDGRAENSGLEYTVSEYERRLKNRIRLRIVLTILITIIILWGFLTSF